MYDKFETITAPYKKQSKVKIISKSILYCLIILIFTFSFLYLGSHYAKPVYGQSMYPTLNEQTENSKDIVIVDKFKKPKNGDIIIFNIKNMDKVNTGIDDQSINLLIKRVIAVGGDRIRYEWNNTKNQAEIYLNGTLLVEDYIKQTNSKRYYNLFKSQEYWENKINPINNEITIPPNMIFCMGDNRGNSIDCRRFGPILIDSIEGVVTNIIKDGTTINSIIKWLFNFK